MFGILSFIVRELFIFGRDVKEARFNDKASKNPNPKTGTYYDRKGVERDAETNKPRYTRVLNNQDVVLLDKNRKIVRNITEEEREKEFCNQMNNPNRKNSVFIWNEYDNHINDRNENHQGYWHVDYKTKDVYVVRQVVKIKRGAWENDVSLRCFMNINTGEIIRPTDLEIEKFKKWKEWGGQWEKMVMTDDEIKDFINKANNKEKRFIIRTFFNDIGTNTKED